MSETELTLDWSNPYASRRSPVLARNVVATSQPLAVQAGLRALRAGGDAMDAALAAAITLAVVEPCSNGIGSDVFALVWDGGALHGLNGSGRAPADWRSERFAGQDRITIGYDSVTVPGAVAAWADLSRRFGRLGFADLFQDAIAYAREGFAISPLVQAVWSHQLDSYREFAEFASVFMPGGRAPQVGELFRNPDQAGTLQDIGASGGNDFYRGRLARAISDHMQANGAALSLADLDRHASSWVQPLALPLGEYTVHELPPNGQGAAVLIALGILDRYGLSQHPVDSVASLHAQIEAMKLAFADVMQHLADPDHMRIDVARLLDEDHLTRRAAQIDPRHACGPGLPVPYDGGTVYLTCADRDGMMVSFIQSNFWGFGSGVVVPGTGISLQNRAAGFSLDPQHVNCVAGGKRPFHTIIPGFVSRDGVPLLSFGVMGGHMQAQGHVQMITRIFLYGQNPQAAADAPRWYLDEQGRVALEPGSPPEWAAGLTALGHGLSDAVPRFAFGGAQLCLRLANGFYCAASDPRKDGAAIGY